MMYMARTTVSIDDDLIQRAKDAGLNVSQLSRKSIKEALEQPSHHFFNTNKEHLPGNTTGAGIYGHGIVATFAKSDDIDKYGGYLGEIEAGDRIYSWENGYGIRAVGIALEDGNSDPVLPEQRLFHSETSDVHEFHAPVHWVAVLDREDAVSTDEVKRIVGYQVWGRGTHAVLNEDNHPELLWDVVVGRATE